MKQYSEIAWSIASRYSGVLASETRDLAAQIDVAVAAERERCARAAEHLNGWGSPPAPELAHHIAKIIRQR